MGLRAILFWGAFLGATDGEWFPGNFKKMKRGDCTVGGAFVGDVHVRVTFLAARAAIAR